MQNVENLRRCLVATMIHKEVRNKFPNFYKDGENKPRGMEHLQGLTKTVLGSRNYGGIVVK